MRVFLFLLTVLAASIASAQTHLSISVNGHPAGFATLSQHVEADGSKVVELRIELNGPDRTVHLNSEARYDSKGMPTRKFQEVYATGSADHKQVVVTFNKDGASVVTMDGAKRTVKAVTLAATAPRASLSEFWLIRDIPKAGQSEEGYQFNPDSLAWELVKTEYHGKKTLKIEGRSVTVHEVLTKRNGKEITSYLDDQGLPVLVDQGDVKMVKIWQK